MPLEEAMELPVENGMEKKFKPPCYPALVVTSIPSLPVGDATLAFSRSLQRRDRLPSLVGS